MAVSYILTKLRPPLQTGISISLILSASIPARIWHIMAYWGRVTHICVGILTIIGPDNGLSPCRRQAIIWTNAGILLIGPLGTNLNEILIEIHTFSFKKMHFKLSSGKWRPFCLGLNVLITMECRETTQRRFLTYRQRVTSWVTQPNEFQVETVKTQ